jgi:putative transposase
MPRKARLGAHGALHHIFFRGIERRRIFLDDEDRDAFLKRLERFEKLNPSRPNDFRRTF